MVQILPEVPSFGTAFARSLGGGLSQGLSQGSQFAMQIMQEKRKDADRAKLIQDVEEKYGESDPSSELFTGSSKRDRADPYSKARDYALLGEHDLSKIETERGKSSEKQRFAREQASEPKLLELENKASTYEQEAFRFDRLNELFQPELENKFPSSFSVGLLTKDGELSPKAASLLSPEAQEAVKLVADNLTGAKDSFGARVTNFDLQAYMKRLPTLLNSAEGRRRVLRDLRIMNEINQKHSEGVLDIVDRYGGPGEISLSKAERLFKKEFAPKMAEYRKEFVNPETAKFNEPPSASRYMGRKIKNPETGEVLVSNGKEWVPE